LEGSPKLQQEVRRIASEWLTYANLDFSFVPGPQADVRIAFRSGEGSWSYIGTQCFSIPAAEPTMNFGWFTDSTPTEELRRTTLHEFGHMLGLVHEQTQPMSPIRWDRDAVIKYYAGPPNNWSAENTESNVLKKYDKKYTQYTSFDHNSIMLYWIDPKLTLDGRGSGASNKELSFVDKSFIRNLYPFVSSLGIPFAWSSGANLNKTLIRPTRKLFTGIGPASSAILAVNSLIPSISPSGMAVTSQLARTTMVHSTYNCKVSTINQLQGLPRSSFRRRIVTSGTDRFGTSMEL
jgi:serralysin